MTALHVPDVNVGVDGHDVRVLFHIRGGIEKLRLRGWKRVLRDREV